MTRSTYQPRFSGVFCTGINVSTALHGSVIGLSEEEMLHQHFKHSDLKLFQPFHPLSQSSDLIFDGTSIFNRCDLIRTENSQCILMHICDLFC